MSAALELVEIRDRLCGCYCTADNNLVLHPTFCQRHKIESIAARLVINPTYERCFDRECDARDRERVIQYLHGESKDLVLRVVPIAHLWLVMARWHKQVPTSIWSGLPNSVRP